MSQKYLFKKNNKIFFIILSIICLILTYIIYHNYYRSNVKNFKIIKNNDKFYIIPKNPGGKVIPDYGIHILEQNFHEENNIYNNGINKFSYSIQLFSSSFLEEIIDKKKTYLSNLLDLDNEKFFIGEFRSNLGNTFILLYNNYENREIAINSCKNLFPKNFQCIIVDIEKLK